MQIGPTSPSATPPDAAPTVDWDVTAELVGALLQQQHPQYRSLPIVPVASGWDNTNFRLGDELLVRLPRRRLGAQLISTEIRWLPTMAQLSCLPIPTLVAVGMAAPFYPSAWAILRWLPGSAFAAQAGTARHAAQLACFLQGLHQAAPREAPRNPYRGVPLGRRDDAVSQALAAVADQLDVDTVAAQWRVACNTAGHAGAARWVHGDLHPLNILHDAEAISGVIDFGDLAAGDPATDLAIAWQMFEPAERDVFWRTYDPMLTKDSALIARSRGWAIFFGLMFLANSMSDPVTAAVGRQTLHRLGLAARLG